MKDKGGLLLVALIVGVLVLGGSPASASVPTRKKGDDVDDGQDLLRRANSPRALAWASQFLSVPGDVADGLARWAGIESAGNPLATSKLGERGLLQSMQKTSKMFWTPAEWDSLVDRSTPDAEHARLAVNEFEWLRSAALNRVTDPPSDGPGQLFFAKLYHQWPKAFTDVKMHGPALDMAAELARKWADAPNSLHRLKAASVVAWNNPEPWRVHA